MMPTRTRCGAWCALEAALPLKLVVLLLVAAAAAPSWANTALPGDPETHRKPMEAHHSLRHPFDQSLVYWKFGGAAVASTKAIRLVPATQSRIGWVWNDYPLESPDWEAEFSIRVFSKPHFGGDGFAFWLLSSEMDPTFRAEHQKLNGPLFGMRDDFKGFGVIFDTYDNDGRRDNPSVYAIKNTEGKFRFNHDNDFANDYVRDSPGNLPFKCTADYRNLGKSFRVLFRYFHNVLHVYIDDSLKNNGFKFCLAVNIDLGSAITERHLAFTAMTGEVADAVEITQITTYYLTNRDAEINDARLQHSESLARSRMTWLFWFVVSLVGGALAGWTLRDIVQLSSMQKTQTNPVYICNELNQWVLPHFYVHFGLVALLLFAGSFWGILLNLPLALFRVFAIVKKSYVLDPAVLTGGSHKGHARPKLSYTTQLYLVVLAYVVAEIYYLANLFA